MLTKVCIFCKCKAPNLPKIVVVLHHHACKDFLSQNNVVITNPNDATLFFLVVDCDLCQNVLLQQY
jgi:hypothetical protein